MGDEANDFTPWLADAENLSLLANTLNLGPVQLQRTEVPVGNFYIDILAQDVDGRMVLIENQFGPTDHTHLGQLMTYLAGQDGGATIIWISEIFREEHRAAIDWLNANTIQSFDFFAVEVEALKIGSSLPAPWFNVVAKPNDWSRGVLRVTQSADGPPLDERGKAYVTYWSGFAAFLQDKKAPYRLNTSPRDYWCSFGIGRTGFALFTTAGFRDRRMGVEIYINHRAAKAAFDLLIGDRQAIEAEFGAKLDWQRRDNEKGCHIVVSRSDLDPGDASQRTQQYEWLLDQMNRFSRAFRDKIRSLPLDGIIGETPPNGDASDAPTQTAVPAQT